MRRVVRASRMLVRRLQFTSSQALTQIVWVFHTQCRQNNRTSSSNHDMCAHIKHTSSLSWYFTHSMRCGTTLQNVDISQTVSMQKQIMSTRPISGDHHQHILACFQCIQVSVSVGALKIVNPDRFLVIIISTDDLKLISFTMYLSDRCVHIYCLIITPVSDQLDITSRTLLHCRYWFQVEHESIIYHRWYFDTSKQHDDSK